MTEKKNKGGRPTKFKPEYIEQAYKLGELGATEPRIARFFGVCVDTITEWKNKHPEFSAALKAGKDIADEEVVASLREKALGHYKTIHGYDTKTSSDYEYEQYFPPDTTAQIFWLKNRQREQWRDKQEVEHSGGLTVNLQIGAKIIE